LFWRANYVCPRAIGESILCLQPSALLLAHPLQRHSIIEGIDQKFRRRNAAALLRPVQRKKTLHQFAHTAVFKSSSKLFSKVCREIPRTAAIWLCDKPAAAPISTWLRMVFDGLNAGLPPFLFCLETPFCITCN
jgi:hypothetical protein